MGQLTLVAAAAVPLEPDVPEARDWVLRELTDPAYAAARPNWFDRLSQAVWNWFTSLEVPTIGGSSVVGPVLAVLAVAAAVVIAFFVFGRPRRRRRAATELFGERDTRDAATMRRDAERALAAGDLELAVLERFRALVRDLDERTLVALYPGTTAHDAARRGADAFPAEGAELAAAADAFDGVRYLDVAAERAAYDRIAALDERLRAARPALTPAGSGA